MYYLYLVGSKLDSLAHAPALKQYIYSCVACTKISAPYFYLTRSVNVVLGLPCFDKNMDILFSLAKLF